MSGIQQLLLGGSPAGYQIERSLRFNSADSAYLNRTPASAGNRRTWTWSGWVKRSAFGANYGMFIGTSGNSTGGFDNGTSIRFDSGNSIEIYDYTNSAYNFRLVTTALYRDPSAWYHVVVGFDTTQATASNRVKLYVNGVQVTVFSTSTYPNQNTDWSVNNAIEHLLGAEKTDTTINGYFNGYLTEINFIDGQALTPSSFGQSNPNTGVWEPIRYTGTYGTNGFYLNFSDNSNTTAATLGKDYSGNGNNWTPNNFSVTAGAGNDSLVDTPTSYGTDTGVGGEVRGNYCTLNPLTISDAAPTYSEGNLRATTASGNMQVIGTMPMNGKNYIEWTALSDNGAIVFSPDQNVGIAQYYNLTNRGIIYNNGTTGIAGSVSFTVNSGSIFSWTTNDIIGIAYDTSNGALTLTKNGGSTVSITVNGMSAAQVFPVYANRTSSAGTTVLLNSGQRPFAYTAPSGFKALCTQNLPTPTIGATSTTQANKYFDASLYTGNGSTQSITNSGSMQPDFVWYKERSSTSGHLLFDAIRGVQNYLTTNATDAETTNSQTLTSFNSNGFSVGNNPASNENGVTYVGWQWNAGGSNATNTSGTITSTVRANTTAGFSIVTYTGTGANATVGHGLGVAPSMIIYKRRSASDSWIVYHASIGAANNLVLNSTAAQQANGNVYWNSTAPTSSVFGAGTDSAVNANASTYVAYCFAAVAGYSAFGSYTGNGSTDGPFIFTGFRPRFILVKSSSGAFDWHITDTSRSPYNQADTVLFPNSSAAETNGGGYFYDLLSNGFKCRNLGSATNGSGATYIYAAFAESPAKYSLAR